jgi:type VI secretion system protein VasJ
MGVEEVLTEAKARLEVMTAPINGGVGEDASYDEAFEAIKAELDKVNALEGGTTDWAAVENHAYGVLSERSKDLRVALYYTAAATQTRKLAGIFDGTVVLLELCNKYWEPMWPALKRRARAAICARGSANRGPVVQSLTPTAKERDMSGARAELPRARWAARGQAGDAYSGMMGLRDSISNLVQRVRRRAAAATTASAKVAPAPCPYRAWRGGAVVVTPAARVRA